MSTDLNIRIMSELNETQQFLLYQEDIKLNVKNFKVAAWEHQYIAPKSIFNVVMPMDITVSAKSDLGKGYMQTKQLKADYNTSWDIYSNNNALDIKKNESTAATEDTIDIYNACETTKFALVSKDNKALFACEVRPDFKMSFSIHPKLYIALSDLEISETFFDAATLSKKPYEIDYEGQSYLTIYLSEDVSTGKVTIKHNFNYFDK